jgi:chromosome partitioning protein
MSMPVTVALISQKGGVGKSTLARGLGAVLAHAGLKVRIADLDLHQSTVLQWDRARRANSVSPSFDVKGYSSWRDAISESDDVELLILDTPGQANQATLAIAANAHLIVQPTGGSLDDLYPGVLLFHELVAAGIDRRRLVFALCKVDSSEEEDARTYIEHAGYSVLPGSLPDQVGYRQAQNRGRSITETARTDLNERADALMLELMTRVAAEIRAQQERAKGKVRKSRGTS